MNCESWFIQNYLAIHFYWKAIATLRHVILANATNFWVLVCSYLPKNYPQITSGLGEGSLYPSPVIQWGKISDTIQGYSQRQIALCLKFSYIMHSVVKHAKISSPSWPQWNVSKMATFIGKISCDKFNTQYFDFLKYDT